MYLKTTKRVPLGVLSLLLHEITKDFDKGKVLEVKVIPDDLQVYIAYEEYNED